MTLKKVREKQKNERYNLGQRLLVIVLFFSFFLIIFIRAHVDYISTLRAHVKYMHVYGGGETVMCIHIIPSHNTLIHAHIFVSPLALTLAFRNNRNAD